MKRLDNQPVVEVQKLLARWNRVAVQLSHPDVELLVDEVAPVLALHSQLQEAGVQFDPMLVALLDKLRAQVFGGGGGGYANGTISYAPRFWTERDALHGLQAELATGTAPIMDHRAGEGPDYRRRLRNARRHRRAVVR